MSSTILLYGADGYLGRLIVAEAVATWAGATDARTFDLVLAGANATRVRELARQHGLPVREIDLDEPSRLASQLFDIDVLVNAASPFADTALVLAAAALQAGCHAVDLNPEVDVYRKLGEFEQRATQARLAMVRSAGPGAAASTLMVDAALRRLIDIGYLAERCIGAIRIALECVPDFSRSSAASVWRALPRDVTIVRAVALPASSEADGAVAMRCDHVPIGILERQFDFSVAGGAGPVPRDARIASAANLVDTVAAGVTVEQIGQLAGTVESYVSITTQSRIAYQVGSQVLSLFAPIEATSPVKALTAASFGALPDGPTASAGAGGHTIVLEVEDEERTRIVDWRLRTPDFYLVGARTAFAVAEAVAGGAFSGLLTAAQVLDTNLGGEPPFYGRALRDCHLDKRVLV